MVCVEGWMGTRGAAAMLGVTLRTLYRLIDEGQLPAYKMGRVIRLQSEDVERFRAGGSADGATGAVIPRRPLPSGPPIARELEIEW